MVRVQHDMDVGAAGPAIAGDMADAVAAVILRLDGPARVLLVGDSLGGLAGPLLDAGCVVQLVVGSASARQLEVPRGVVVHVGLAAWDPVSAPMDVAVVWNPPANLPAGIVGLPVRTMLLLGPVVEAMPSSWWDVACADHWGLHSASWVMRESVEGFATLALARPGVRARSQADMRQANLFGLAAALIRAGDEVLVHAPAGPGAWRILQEQSRCSWLAVSAPAGEQGWNLDGGGAGLHPRDGRQVDFLVIAQSACRDDQEQVLASAGRNMRRSGRLLLELDTFPPGGWETIQAQLERHGFAVDRAWLLAGGTVAEPAQRTELSLPSSLEPEQGVGLHVAVLAIRVEGSPYPRTPEQVAPNISAFQRDYEDASVVRLIVAMGHRIASASLRRITAERVLDEAASGSADQGAALCVLLYGQLDAAPAQSESLLRLAQDYVSEVPRNPTVLRWQISIAYVLARIHQATGRLRDAEHWYGRVLEHDVLGFSPLLGTKTTSAAVALGWLAFARRDLDSARRAWTRGLDEARRLAQTSSWSEVVGDPEAPETFGMPEFAAVMDEASRAAAALRLTAESPLRPGLAWEWANRSWQCQMKEIRREQRLQLAWRDELQQGKDWLDEQYRQLNDEVARLSADRSDLSDKNAGLLAAYRLAHAQVERELTRQQQLYADLLAAYSLAHERAESQGASQQRRYDDLLTTYRLAHADARRTHAELEQAHQELLKRQTELQQSHELEKADSDARAQELQERYSGLLSNYHFARQHADARIAALDDRYAGLLAAYRLARARSRQEIAQLRGAVDEQQISAADLQFQLGQLGDDHELHQEAHARLVQAVEGLGGACARLMGSKAQPILDDNALAAEANRIAKAIDDLPCRGLLRLLLRVLGRFSRGGK